MKTEKGVILKEDCRLYHLAEKLETGEHMVAQGILRLIATMSVGEKLIIIPPEEISRKYRKHIQHESPLALILNGNAILHMLRRGHLGCTSRGGHCDPSALSANELKLMPRVFQRPRRVAGRSDAGGRRRLEISKTIKGKTYVLVVTANRRFTKANVVTFYNGLPLEEKEKLKATAPRVDVC